MPDLPSGTVTFLFTDIEGSTALWERDQVAITTAVARHLRFLLAEIEANASVLFKTVGDAIQTAFPTARGAVAAAVAAQRALPAESFCQPSRSVQRRENKRVSYVVKLARWSLPQPAYATSPRNRRMAAPAAAAAEAMESMDVQERGCSRPTPTDGNDAGRLRRRSRPVPLSPPIPARIPRPPLRLPPPPPPDPAGVMTRGAPLEIGTEAL